MTLRQYKIVDLYYKLIEKGALPYAQRWSATPDQLTLIGVIIAGLVPLGFWGHPLIGLVLMITSGLIDSLDGLLARRQKQCSRFGAFLDSTLDRLSDFFYLMGFWVRFWPIDRLLFATGLIFMALLFTLLISYVKARAEALGGCCDTGFMERGIRVLYLSVWALVLVLLPSMESITLWWGLGLYCFLTLFTVIQRICMIRRNLNGQEIGH